MSSTPVPCAQEIKDLLRAQVVTERSRAYGGPSEVRRAELDLNDRQSALSSAIAAAREEAVAPWANLADTILHNIDHEEHHWSDELGNLLATHRASKGGA